MKCRHNDCSCSFDPISSNLVYVYFSEEENEEEEEEVEEGEEDEEEEESTVNSYNDQLTTFLEDLLTQQKEQNEQGLQLAVHKDGDGADEEEEEEET